MKDQFAMLDEKSYLSRVERTMNKLRATCLGQNVRLTAILPEHFKKSPSEEQARQVAEQLLFVLATVAENEDLPNGQLLECLRFCLNCAARLAGNRTGRRIERKIMANAKG